MNRFVPNAGSTNWRLVQWLAAAFTLWVAGGATCYRQTAKVNPFPPPQVFTGVPTTEQLAEVMNRTDAITQLSSNSVSVEMLSMSNVPRLTATMAVDRPKRFRMRASIPILLGSGIDLGSNDEHFWFEVPESMSQTLYFARHDQYQRQPVRSILPVDPSWFVEALGLVHLDPAEVVEGPIQRTDGRLEVRSMMQYPDGLYSRVCIIEPTAGYVTDQILYGPNGKMIAGASGTNHRYYAEQQCALPHVVQIRLIPDAGPPLELKLDVGNYAINQIVSGDTQLFVMPTTASQKIDVTTLGIPNSPQAYPGSPPYSAETIVTPPPPRSAYLVPVETSTRLTDSYR